MTPLAHRFNARKKACSTVSSTRACHDGPAAAHAFLADLVTSVTS
eukprot:COSAG05_NODE_13990_length_412_cov_0.485623_1_plen_44_part_01